MAGYPHRYKFLTATGIFLLFLFTGGAWLSIVQFVPAGISRATLTLISGFVFAGVFLWMLIERVRHIYAGTDHPWLTLVMTLVNLLLMLLAFATVYQRFGIIDSTQDGSPVVHDFWTSAYFSVITFTTVGYGDFYPRGLGRAMAALQGFIGYMVLGILASTAASMLQWSVTKAEAEARAEREQHQGESS